MNNNIDGIPFYAAEFNKHGGSSSLPVIPAGTTDIFVISHGWNNDQEEAWHLYEALFTNFKAVAPPTVLTGRNLVIVGVFWPSKKFNEMLAVESLNGMGGGGGAAGLGMAGAVADPAEEARLVEKIDELKQFFTEGHQQASLEQAKALIPQLEHDPNAREQFVDCMRALVDGSRAEKDDASLNFFRADPLELMERLRIEEDDVVLSSTPTGGGAAAVRLAAAPGAGGAAGLIDFFKGFKTAATNVVNFTTYYEMKNRAGIVGAQGVAPMLDGFPRQARIHLIGHSFGGRVVTAAAAESTTDRIRSMSLLQAAFSHNGFSQSMKGFFRKVVDQQRVRGAILVTHTKNDRAVGIAYPIASRLAGQVTAALGDENDRFGGLGRNGAQKMNVGEVIAGTLQAVAGPYNFAAGKLFNAVADQFIADHGDVTGREVAYAIACVSLGESTLP